MRVLFVSHTGRVSGAELSLLDLLAGLRTTPVEYALACPGGELEQRAATLGVRSYPIRDTSLSFRPHPLHTTRGVLELLSAARGIRRARADFRPHLVHANSTRAGLSAVPALTRGGPPLVVHVRDCLPAKAAGRAVRALLWSRSALVLANSRYTAESFRLDGGARVVYNGVDLEHFDPAAVDRARARSELGLDETTPALAVVAQLTPWKGQDDAVRALARLRARGLSAQLLLVGSAKFADPGTRFDNPAFERGLLELARTLGVEDSVRLLGERDDVRPVLAALDLLLVPSWEEPFGRSLLEAMAMGVPVIATERGGPAEIVRPGEGMLVPPRSPDALAEAVENALSDRRSLAEMAKRGRRRAERFSSARHVEGVLAAYDDVLGGRRDGLR